MHKPPISSSLPFPPPISLPTTPITPSFLPLSWSHLELCSIPGRLQTGAAGRPPPPSRAEGSPVPGRTLRTSRPGLEATRATQRQNVKGQLKKTLATILGINPRLSTLVSEELEFCSEELNTFDKVGRDVDSHVVAGRGVGH